MSDTLFLERCQSYIDCHLQRPKASLHPNLQIAPSITLSRQTGAGGITTAEHLAAWLTQYAPDPHGWTVFDKNLVNKVLEDSKLPSRIAQFMPEDKVSSISDAMEELLGLHPASWKLIRRTTETILQLAELGHAILVGRGANVITQHLKNVVHVRLVGSLHQRAERIMQLHKISRNAAASFIRKTDTGRQRYLKKYYGADPNDPLLYHLTINTDEIPETDAACLIGNWLLRKFYPEHTPASLTASQT